MVIDPSQRTEQSPKNPGDRGFGHGDTVTLTLQKGVDDNSVYSSDDDGEYLPGGSWVRFNGDGTVSAAGDVDSDATDGSEEAKYDAVLKHKRYVGQDGSIHLQGVVRVSDNETEAEAVLDSYDDGDFLVHLG